MKEDNQEIKLLVRLKNSQNTEKKTPEIKTDNANEKSNIKSKENQDKKKSTTPTNRQGDKKDNKKPQKNESTVTPIPESKKFILKALKKIYLN